MYASRYDASTKFSPTGLVAAAGINAALVAALLFAAPDWVPGLPDDPSLTATTIELAPLPPEPAPPTPRSASTTPRPAPPVDRSTTIVPGPTTDAWPEPGPTVGIDPGGVPGGTGEGVVVDPPAPPLILGPQIDPRYARDLQPPYPPAEQRLGNDGKVTVRVLVGPDGRVLKVERVSATSDAFFHATEMQALRRWRFRPGTRDGVAQEGWRTMTVTFVLNDA